MPRRTVYRSVIESSSHTNEWRKDPHTEAYIAAYRRLPEADRVIIDGLVAHLAETITGMGVQSALELLARLGIFMAARPAEYHELMLCIERKQHA